MDSNRYDELRGRLLGLLILLGDRLDLKTQEWVQEFLDYNELGLGLETMADALGDAEAELRDHERIEMLALVAEMEMDGRVARALALCPRNA